MRPPRSAAPLWCVLVAACSSPGPDHEARLGDLSACPALEAPWRAVLDDPAAQDDVSALRSELKRLMDGCPDSWGPAWAMGESLMREDLNAEAAPHLELALGRARAAGDPTGVSLSANGLGWTAAGAGDYPAARGLFEEALEQARKAERVDLASFVHNNFAGLYNELGQYALARDHLEAAETGLNELGRTETAISLAHNRAILLLKLGNVNGARELLEANHHQAAADGNAWLRDGAAIVLGNLHLAIDDPRVALGWFERASNESPYLEFRAKLGVARAQLELGAAAAAGELFLQLSRFDDRHAAMLAELFRARALSSTGRREQALPMLERLIEEAESIGAGEIGWVARSDLARVLMHEGRQAEAIPLLREALEILGEQSSSLDPLGQGLYFFRNRNDPFVDLAAALADDDPEGLSEVWSIASQARARALNATLENVDSPLPALQASLAHDELILNYLVGEQRGLVIAVARDRVRTAALPGRKKLLGSFAAYRDSLEDPATPPNETGRQLTGYLIEPVAGMVANATTLYVVPDRELALLPFSALPVDRGFLGQDKDVAVLPLGTSPPRWSGDWHGVLLAGRPSLDEHSELGELPWAGYELSNLRSLWGETRTRLLDGERFSRDALIEAAGADVGLVHLATHAVASTSDPRRCGVILSHGDRLGIDEIAGLDLEASLVVLSACSTGQGELVPGEGVIGLGWAFLRAGARGIVVSHWTADDVSSAKLMVEFHRQLESGANPVRALARARRARARKQPHPAHWALFDIVLGPDQPL